MARKTSEKSVSLFPFLAVLVCTMGALILLLLLTTRRIQKEQSVGASVVKSEVSIDFEDIDSAFGLTIANDQPAAVSETAVEAMDAFADTNSMADVDSEAEANAEDPPQLSLSSPETDQPTEFDFPDFNLTEPKVPQVTDFELKVEIDRLAGVLDADRKRHAELLAEIAAAEQKLAQSSIKENQQRQAESLSNLKQQETVLRAQLADQQVALAELEQQLDRTSETTEEAERILRVRESALVSLRKLADDASSNMTAGTEKTVLEFSNSTGTSQRPIVVEVTAAGFRFSPSDVLVTIDEMEGFPQNDNPLLSGIAALHQQLESQSASTSPYVLLLVRPDGSLPFYTIQKTLKTADINFGYELVEQSRSIFVGRPAAGEKEIVQQAVESAIKRRNELYGGMLAEIKKLQSQREEEPERQARLMPDGRITVPGEKDHNLSGRFFAGGERPPGNGTLPDNNAFTRQPSPPADDAFANREQPGVDASPFSGESPFAREQAESSESFSDVNGGNPPAAGIRQFTNPFEQYESADASVAATEESPESRDSLRLEDLFPRDAVQSEGSEIESPGSPMTGSSVASRFGDRPLGDSEFTSQDDQIEASAIIPDAMESFETALIQKNSTLPNKINLDWLNQSPIVSRLTPTGESSSQTPPDWSESVTAPPDAASRTVGAAENSQATPADEQPTASSKLMASLEPNQNHQGPTQAFGDQEESALSKFMRSLDDEIEAKRPDPYLVSLLESAKTRQSQTQLPPRHPVTVTLQNGSLQVGNSTPINVTGSSLEQVLNATVEELADQMELLKTADGSYPMPTIDFRTDAASAPLRSALQRELEKMDVTTRSTSTLPTTSSPTSASPSWPIFDTEGPKRQSATPMNSSPLIRGKGGLSI